MTPPVRKLHKGGLLPHWYMPAAFLLLALFPLFLPHYTIISLNDIFLYIVLTVSWALFSGIRILDECGLVDVTRSGREIHYQLKLEKMQEIDVWLEQFRELWERRYRQLDDLLTDLKGENQ